MSLELVSIPAVVVKESPEIISRLVGTDCPVQFEFVRHDGIVTAEESNGFLQLNGIIQWGAISAVGQNIGIYDPVFNRMIEASVVLRPANDIIITDVPWEARYTADLNGTYVVNYTLAQGLYLEFRIKANDAYLPETYNAQQNSQGRIIADVSGALRSIVTDEKVGDYTAGCVAETNQSGKIELEYRERYPGDSNDWIAEGNVWYYVMATRSKEQGCNLHEYFSADGVEGEFFNEFVKPNWNIGVPMDLSFWWNPAATAAAAVIEEKDLAGNVLDTHNINCPTAGKGYLNSLRINLTEIQAYTRRLGVTINFTW